MPRPYPLEFRQRALDLVRSGRPVAEVAELLGIDHPRGPRKPVHLLGFYLQGEERGPAVLARHGRRSLRQRGRRVVLGDACRSSC